jgi:hypothetical protein
MQRVSVLFLALTVAGCDSGEGEIWNEQTDDPMMAAEASATDAPVMRGALEGVSDWEEATGLTLSDDAGWALSDHFLAHFPDLSVEDARIAAELYLYELRDLRSTRTGEDQTISAVEITGGNPEVIMEQLTVTPPAGFLRVTSNPPQADIIIDDVPSGRTIRKFVLNPGLHTVLVSTASGGLSCEGTVEIVASDTIPFHCP